MTDAQCLASLAVRLYAQNGGSIEAALDEAEKLIAAAEQRFAGQAPVALDLSGFVLEDGK